MNQELEIRKHIQKLRNKKKKAEQDLIDLKETIEALYQKRDEVYKSVQDFTVDYVTTTKAIGQMAAINREIKSEQAKIPRRENVIDECQEDINRAEL